MICSTFNFVSDASRRVIWCDFSRMHVLEIKEQHTRETAQVSLGGKGLELQWQRVS